MPSPLPSPDLIMSLASNEVFVFGANASGFHGAGAAGYACRGTAKNTWRMDQAFLSAMKSPIDSPERVGKWAILGQARGLQQGREGSSYGIVTVMQPGNRRSIPLDQIAAQVRQLSCFARTREDFTFLVSEIGCQNAGWTPTDIAPLFRDAPSNVRLPKSFLEVLK